MVIYFLLFFISIFFAFRAEKRRKNDVVYVLYMAVIIVLNSFIAGARNDDIGTDISFYAYYVFHTDAYLNLEDVEIDLAIVLLAKFVHLFSDTFGVFLFFVEAWILGFACYAATLIRKRLSIVLFITFFCLMAYNQSLNIMRQSMAMSVIMCAVVHLMRKEYMRMFLFMVVAYFCHSTSIIGLLFIIAYYGAQQFGVKKILLFVSIMGVALVVSFNALFYQLISIALSNNLLASQYERYAVNDYGEISRTTIFISIMYVISFGVILKDKVTVENFLTMFALIMALALAYCSLGGEIVPRIRLYFTYINILFFSMSLYRERKYVTWTVLAIAILNFVISIWISDYGETTPYRSKYLGI